MKDSRSRAVTWSLGALFILCLFIGGGTQTSLITDAIIEMVTIFVCVGILFTKQSTAIDRRLLVFPLIVMAAMAMQAAPLPIGLAERFWPAAARSAWAVSGDGAKYGFATINLAATIGALACVATASLLLWTLASLSAWQLRALLPFIGVGVLANVAAGLVQMSVNHFEPVSYLLPYEVQAGFFANQNHFATLLLMTLPPLAVAAAGPSRLAAGLALFIALVLLLAVGSAAGVVVGFGTAFLSFGLMGGFRSLKPASLAAMICGCGALAAAAAYNVATKHPNVNAGRLDFLRTSLDAIRDNPVFGAGYGGFVQAYQIYERTADIYGEYVNHAHNDYIELVVEGGAVAAALIALYFALLLTRLSERLRGPVSLTAFLCILVVLIHSAVDYPLRTLAILYLFVYAHAVLFADEPSEAPQPVAPRRPPPPPVFPRADIGPDAQALIKLQIKPATSAPESRIVELASRRPSGQGSRSGSTSQELGPSS